MNHDIIDSVVLDMKTIHIVNKDWSLTLREILKVCAIVAIISFIHVSLLLAVMVTGWCKCAPNLANEY